MSLLEVNNLKMEVAKKMNYLVRKWITNNSEYEIRRNENNIFGLFKKHVLAVRK